MLSEGKCIQPTLNTDNFLEGTRNVTAFLGPYYVFCYARMGWCEVGKLVIGGLGA
jgi:hypothetical protein